MVSLRMEKKIELDREVDNQIRDKRRRTGKLPKKKIHFQDFNTFFDTKDRLLS